MRARVPTPNDPTELLDVLDEAGEPVGRGKPRADVHRDGDWHRVFHLWVVRGDGSVLLQRRSKHKDLEPGKVDVSVGGHYRFGETIVDVVREAEEEIGLVVRPGALAELGSLRSEHRYEDAVDREVQEIYAVRDDRDLSEFRLDCAEVSVVYEAPIQALISLCRGSIRSLPVAGHDCQNRVNNALLIEDDLIAQARETTAVSLERVRDWLAESTQQG